MLKAADVRYDVRGYLLSELVSLCLGNRATLPWAYRARYERYVQREAIAFVESFTAQLLFGSGRFSPHEYRYREKDRQPLGDISTANQTSPMQLGFTTRELCSMTVFRILVPSSPFPERCWSLKHRCFMRRREQILMTAEQVFGNPELAEAWLTKQAIGLSRRLPCMLLETDQGYMEVADFLVRLDYGVY